LDLRCDFCQLFVPPIVGQISCLRNHTIGPNFTALFLKRSLKSLSIVPLLCNTLIDWIKISLNQTKAYSLYYTYQLANIGIQACIVVVLGNCEIQEVIDVRPHAVFFMRMLVESTGLVFKFIGWQVTDQAVFLHIFSCSPLKKTSMWIHIFPLNFSFVELPYITMTRPTLWVP